MHFLEPGRIQPPGLRVIAKNDLGHLLIREVTRAYRGCTPMPLLVINERTGRPFPLRYTRWLEGSWRDGNGTIPRTITLAPSMDPKGFDADGS